MKQIKVLLAEDSRFLRGAATTVLQSKGYHIYIATDGEQAIKMAAENQPDVVILDLILPKIQGLDVLKTLRQNQATAQVPVIVFSAEVNHQDFSAYGPVDFIAKDNLMLNALPDRVEQNLLQTIDA
jgi:CheY-like chemotaxis protein